MAIHLYRLGGWAFRHRRAVLAGWLAILVGVIACATMFGGRTSDKFVVPGTESQQAQDLLEEKFPEASGAIELSSTAPTLATMLGLAVGIDYALFILSRYRQNLGDGVAPAEAAANATATAGSAVVFAGASVIIALVGLVVVQIPFLTVMGLAAAVASLGAMPSPRFWRYRVRMNSA